MKVCSLIDTNPDPEDPLQTSTMAKGENDYLKQADSLSSSSLNDQTHLNIQHKHQKMHTFPQETPGNESIGYGDGSQGTPQTQNEARTITIRESAPASAPASAPESVPESVAMSLLGPGVRGFPMSRSLFEDVIRLRTEQEKTEQERLKIELVSKTKAVLEYAVEKNIPPESLVMLSRDNQPPQATLPHSQARPSSQYLYPGDSRGQYLRPSYMATSPPQPQPSRQYENSNNASAVEPTNFRFGGPPQFNPQSPQNVSNRRPRSPAKLGAIAVANLANPITPYRPANRTIPFHQRHYSMPTEAMVSDNGPAERRYARARNQPLSQSINPAEGQMSSMQVRPLPARPLHNQTRKGSGISQDPMTQHQQVIQFHHWISENPGEKPTDKFEHNRTNSVSSQSLTSKAHKRHKSTDISMDLQRVGTTENQ